MALYMKYGSIDGDVTASGHEKWIQLNSFQWGVGRGVSSPVGAAADREASEPSVSEIVVTKEQDKASVKILGESLLGSGEKVTIDFTRTDKDKLVTFLTFTLEEVMISGYSLSSGGERPAESISLNFTKVEMKLTPTGAANKSESPEAFTYSIAEAKKM